MAAGEKAPPAAAVAELKAFLRIEGDEEDALLAAFLRAATEAVEASLGRVLIARAVVERRRVRAGAVALGVEPVLALEGVSLPGADGELGMLEPGRALLELSAHGRGRVGLSGIADGVEVEASYRAGMAEDWNGLPELLRLAVLRAAAHVHRVRDAPDDPGLPVAVARMLAPWRARRML